mmetsp:Transcript_17092/g.20579  ORF Transcript_17092/g.20579 Transcript_17092/m.20579 type:complete len:331 (+) Transcript_17092:574-1566(+)
MTNIRQEIYSKRRSLSYNEGSAQYNSLLQHAGLSQSQSQSQSQIQGQNSLRSNIRRTVPRSVSFRDEIPGFDQHNYHSDNLGISNRRRLSEHGKHLLLHSYSDNYSLVPNTKSPLAATSMEAVNKNKNFGSGVEADDFKHLKIQIPEKKNKSQEVRQGRTKKSAIKNRKNGNGNETNSRNAFAAFDYEPKSPQPLSPRRTIAAQLSPRSNYASQLTWSNANIESIPEIGNEMGGWETVSKAKAKAKKKEKKTAASVDIQLNAPILNSTDYGYESDLNGEFGDISEIQGLETDISDGRVWGSDTKTRQFKAVEKRNWAMNKRNEQRRHNNR